MFNVTNSTIYSGGGHGQACASASTRSRLAIAGAYDAMCRKAAIYEYMMKLACNLRASVLIAIAMECDREVAF